MLEFPVEVTETAMYGAIVLFLIAAFLGLQAPPAAAQGRRTVEANSCSKLMVSVPRCPKRFLPACQRITACTLNGQPSRVCTSWRCQRIL
jgi:hypothetical protein